MMNKLTSKAAVTLAIVLPLIVGGLFAQRVAAANEAQQTSQPDPMQFVRGAKTWANTCSRCHNMRDPRELRDDQWRGVVAHMRVRAGLTGQEARDVLLFLQQSN